MPKSNKSKNLRTSEEIQETGNIILDNMLENIRVKFQDLKIIKTSEEHQKDRGVDFQVELVEKPSEKTTEMFKLQMKATETSIKILGTTANKGKISFQVDNRHIRYYLLEMQWPLLFLLCDNTTRNIYWHAIQLDETLIERMDKSISKNKQTIQIYIDPKNVFNPENFVRFNRDIDASKKRQFFNVSINNSNSLIFDLDFKIDKNHSLLDQLFSLMEYLYEEVEFLPVYMLVQYYPFNVSSSQISYYDEFKLHTDNEELFDMLSSFVINDDGSIQYLNSSYIEGVNDYDTKVKSILSKFTQNHIYYIISLKTRKEVSVQFFDHKQCNCAVCCYYVLNIPDTIKKLKNTDNCDLNEQIKSAYLHYELGNYLESAKYYGEISRKALQENKKTLNLIAKFNLVKLGKLISRTYLNTEGLGTVSKLMDIELGEIVYSSKSNSYHRKLFNYIKESKFFAESAQQIQSAISKLRGEYQSYISGGDFSAYYFRQLINSYAQINSFISGNRIVYDHFGEFSGLVDQFTEGIFIALALQKDGNRLIPCLIDFHVNQLIFNGNHKLTLQYFNKYHFKSIPYENSERFFVLIRNLLSNHHLVSDSFNGYFSDEEFSWRNGYAEIFANSLTLGSMIEMGDNRVNSISAEIMNCCSKKDLPSPNCFKQLISFFDRKKTQLSNSLLIKLTGFFLKFDSYEIEDLLEIFCKELSSRNLNFTLSKTQRLFLFEKVDNSEKVEYPRFNLLIAFYPIVEDSIKERIKNCILKQLRNEFDTYKL